MVQPSKQPDDSVEVRIDANPAYLCVTRSVVRNFGELVGLSTEDVDAVTLALEEAMTNVIRHGYGGPCGRPIIVRFRRLNAGEADGDGLEIVVRDYGRQVDPNTIRSRDLDEVRPGGLGVHIIKSIMDEVEYSCPDDGGMELRMVKHIHVNSQKRSNHE